VRAVPARTAFSLRVALTTLPAEIPVTFAQDNGVWYHVRQGGMGLLCPDERGAAVAYVVIEPASHYYRMMTRSERMAVLIGERY